jgi:two-component system sensor histidine kinase BaeS
MMKNPRIKLFLLLLAVSAVALCAALLLRERMIGDFQGYLARAQGDRAAAADAEAFFRERSNRFLLATLAALGGLSLALSMLAPKKPGAPSEAQEGTPGQAGSENPQEEVAAYGSGESSGIPVSADEPGPILEPRDQDNEPNSLLTDAAQELRTPVEAMQDELTGMLDGVYPADREQMQSLYQETDRIKRILDGMEDLVQAQASGRGLEKQPVLLRPLLSDVIELTKNSLNPLYGGDLAFSLECGEDLSVSADPACLERIVKNLLSNAVKAVAGSGRVSLAASGSKTEILVSVADSGTGIRPAHLSHVFERFFRGAGSGLGLGLAIAQELAEAHGGRIEVKSAWGKGSVFTLRLPAAG